jgi:hypothetical protein
MKHILPYSLGLTLILVLTLTSCSEPPPLKLTSAQREQIDTLYEQRIMTLIPILDSLCEQMLAQELSRSVDSILAERKAQEKKLREKYQTDQ